MSDMDRAKLEELLSAYLDGEVNSREAKLVEDVLREDESARRLLDELRQTAALVSSLPRHDAPRSIADDLWSRVERNELLGDLEAAPAVPRGRRSRFPGLLSIAATLAMVVAGGLWIIRGGPGPGARQVDRVAMRTGAEEETALPRGAVGKSALKRERLAGRSPDDVASPDMAKGQRGTAGGVIQRRSARKARTLSPSRGGAASRVSEPVSPPRSVPERPERTNLLAMANVEQKLAAGVDAGKLQDHRFTNETVRLQLTLQDEATREKLADTIADYLKNRRVADLAAYKANGSRRRDRAGRFFHRGQPGVNFDDANQHQILVRIRRYELDGLFAEMAEQAGATEEVALASGLIAVKGFDEARNMLRYPGGASRHAALQERARTGHEPMPPEPQGKTTADADAGDEPSTGVDDFLADIMKVIGLDMDQERALDGSPAQAEATATTPAVQPDASRDERFSLFTSTRPLVLEAKGQGDVASKPAEKRIASAKPRRAFTEGETPSPQTRRSLVNNRWQASQDASRRRAGKTRTAPAAGLAGDLPNGDREGLHARVRTPGRRSATGEERVTKTHATRERMDKASAGPRGSEGGFVTLVVELMVAKPESPPSGARPAKVTRPPDGPAPSHTSRPGDTGTGKARKTQTKSKHKRVPQE